MQTVGLLMFLTCLLTSGVKAVDEELPRADLPTPSSFATPSPPLPPPAVGLGVAVEGVVYCMNCRLPGYNKDMNASPLRGVGANLQCNETKNGMTVKATTTTDANGYFLILASNVKLGADEMKQCKVVLKYLPLWCNKPYYPNPAGTPAGIPLKYERVEKIGLTKWALFTAGFYEFAPYRTAMCPRLP